MVEKPTELSDLNAVDYGVHRYANSSQNTPSSSNGYVIAIKRSEDVLGQIALDDMGTLYSRARVGESWKSWK